MSTVGSATSAAAAAAASAAAGATGTGGTTTTAGSSTAAQAQSGLNTNYSNFLTLLTTQLQNQDPTAPADTNEITSEIAQMSEVQAQLNTNTLLQQLVSMFSASQANNAVSYIGKQVDATGNQVDLQSSQAALVYSLPAGASSAVVTITNSAGQTVYSAPGTTISGRNQVLWQGTTTAGTTAPDGTYTFSVTAKDANGNPLTATTYTTGTVTAVETQNGVQDLSLGNLSIPVSSVQSIYTSGTNPGV